MHYNDHSELEGKHAFLSASKYHWVNYTPEKMAQVYSNYFATEKGTILHDFASRCIKLGQKLPRSKKTLNLFVNDAIGFRMRSEQVLYYSDNCFGTTDAILYDEKTKLLRIHDLKTGVTPSSMLQLEIYASLFFLEYGIDPQETSIELRIYQNNDIQIEKPDTTKVLYIIQKIKDFDKIISSIKKYEW